ncbi:auxin-responsive protein IAA33-like [Setaria italica]|uniref:auxin-responsive protein IAA33-like n=1 Tax=Setaria italica TaxID=4555 RepID=UPI000BE54608|nr:auxin-responsive protein IAA33-like [Setaria italica]
MRLKLSVKDDDEVAANVVPPVTVVLDGLAGALRCLFVDADEGQGEDGLDRANAIPGHVVAYEDMEDDLLLAGHLKWKIQHGMAAAARLPALGGEKE